jgi:Pectate lyase, N terminus
MANPTFAKAVYLFLFSIICIFSFGKLEANVDEDKYWKSRAVQAEMIAKSAYDPHPHATTNRFNKAVHK